MSDVGSVWAVAQCCPRAQRAGRFVAGSGAHPARMLPALARRLVLTYSNPGDLVVDPMCGIGTTLVEAIHAGRHALGIEYEPRWAALARENVAHAQAQGASGHAHVVTGDARTARELVPLALAGRVDLIVTSPPYGASIHGNVRRSPDRLIKWDNQYSGDRTNLARLRYSRLLPSLETIFSECRHLLRPGGIVAVTVRPWRRADALVDFPGAVVAAAERADLVLSDRRVALLCGLRGDRQVPRATFFALERMRYAHRRGVPLRVIAHEDVLAFAKPDDETAADRITDCDAAC